MECISCKAPNPDGKKFCGDCGSPLGYSLTALIERTVVEQVDAGLEKKLKDSKQAEFDITERVATRLLGWAKAATALAGIPLVILGGFGIKSVFDINTVKEQTQKLKEETQKLTDDARDKAKQLLVEVGDAQAKIGPITAQYKALEADLVPARQTRDELAAMRDQVRDIAAEVRDNSTQLSNVQEKLANFQAVPHPSGSLHMGLDKVIGLAAVQKIQDSGSLTFQTVGATGGARDGSFQRAVAEQLGNQFKAGKAHNPAFLYLLGNIVFYNGETSQYYAQFYDPYRSYPAPILAVPGNHDGDPLNPTQQSLEGFLRNFCAKAAVRLPEAGDLGRTAMTEPNVYWTLDTPFATVIGLYTNVPAKGALDTEQTDWFRREMKAAAPDKALIVMMNHPAFSMDARHAGSARMVELLDGAIKYAGRAPEAVFAADVFNYQRMTRRTNGRDSVYIIAGVGGYPILHPMPQFQSRPPILDSTQGVSLDSYFVQHGFVQVTVSKTSLSGQYLAVTKTGAGSSAEIRDSFDLDLQRHQLTRAEGR